MKKNDRKPAYTYVVECNDGSLYTGWTNDIVKRIRNHNDGNGAKYTRSRLPVKLVYYEVFATKQEAMQREYAFKLLTRADKLTFIEEHMTKALCMQCDEVNRKSRETMQDTKDTKDTKDTDESKI